MKKIDLGQTIGILVNIGVIAGIVFLGIELKQNNSLMASSARTARAELSRTLNLTLAESPDLSEMIVKAQAGEVLDAAENYRLGRFYSFMIAGRGTAHREYQQGLLSVDDLQIALMRNAISDRGPWPGLKNHFDSNRHLLAPDFVQFMEESVFEQLSE